MLISHSQAGNLHGGAIIPGGTTSSSNRLLKKQEPRIAYKPKFCSKHALQNIKIIVKEAETRTYLRIDSVVPLTMMLVLTNFSVPVFGVSVGVEPFAVGSWPRGGAVGAIAPERRESNRVKLKSHLFLNIKRCTFRRDVI